MSTQQTKIQYIADGTNTDFQTPFSIFIQDGAEVYINESLISNTEYSVILDEDKKATISFNNAPQSQSIITISRNLPIERNTQFQEGGALRANTLNYEFDYQISCIQDLKQDFNRAMSVPVFNTTENLNLTLPLPNAGKVLKWNETQTGFENSEYNIDEIINQTTEHMQASAQSAETANINANISKQWAIANDGVLENNERSSKSNANLAFAISSADFNQELNTFQSPIGVISKGEKGDKGDAGENGQDGTTVSINLNGTTYTHTQGEIALPNLITTNTYASKNKAGIIKMWLEEGILNISTEE